MSNSDVKLTISGENRGIKRTLSDTERAYVAHERKTKAIFGRVGRSLGHTALGFTKSLVAPVTALAGGAAVLAAGKNLMDYESQLTRLAIAGNLTAAQQKQLNKEIMDSAFATGQSRNAILSGIDTIVEQTGDLQFARDAIRDIGVASTATGAEMQSLAALANQLKEKLNIGKSDLSTALNLLTVQGKAGSFNLKEMANNGERLFAAAGRFDMSGLDSLRRFGALLQVARMGTGSSEQATTSIEGIFSEILDKQKQISRYGVKIYSDKDKTKLKSVDSIVKDIIRNTNGREDLLGNIFGRQSIRGITTLAKLYRDTGGFDLFEELVSADSKRAGEILLDFARYAETATFQLRQLGTLATTFIDPLVGGVLSTMSADLRELTSNPEKMEEFKKQLADIGRGVGDTAANVYSLVAALTGLIPLLEIITGTMKGVQWMKNPFKGSKFFVDPEAQQKEMIEDLEKKAQDRKYKKLWKKAEDNPTYNSQMYQQLFQQHLGQFSSPTVIVQPPDITNEISISNVGDIQSNVDSKSSTGTTNVKIKKLPRGVHPVAK